MLIEKKILESERNSVYVKSTEGSYLTGTVEQNKNVFDKYPELIKEKFNALVDLLISLGLDTVVEDLADRYTISQTDELVEAETNTLVEDVSIDLTTGAITITKKDGTFKTIDTALEKVPASFELIEENDQFYLRVTNVDGSSTQTEVTNLMNQFTFSDGATVRFSTTKNGTTTTVTAEIVDKSITLSKLADEVTSYINESVASIKADRTAVEGIKVEVLNASQTVTQNTQIAQTSATNAQTSEDNSKASETAAGENARLAAQYAQESKNYRDEAAEIVGGDFATKQYVSDAVKEIKPVYQEYLMIASGWTENTYSFENVYPAETYDIEISLSSSATNEMVEAFNSATITGSVESNIVTAFGDVPTIDILVIVKVVKK